MSTDRAEIGAAAARAAVRHGAGIRGEPGFPATDYRASAPSSARSVVLARLVSSLVREELLDPGRAAERGLRLPLGRVTATGRLAPTGPITLSEEGTLAARVVRDPVELIDVLLRLGLLGGDPASWRRLRSDLAEGVAGLARALRAERVRARRLRASVAGDEPCSAPFAALVAALRAEHGAAGSLLSAFEQWVIDGHPMQPVAKTRTGMSTTDASRYAPEFGVGFDVPLVALARHAVSGADHTGELDGAGAVRRELRAAFPRASAAADSELLALGLSPTDYVPVPVHPHQLRSALPELHGELFTAGTAVPLETSVPSRPLMSLRTLDAREPEHPPGLQVKTAVEVRLTGAVRGISPGAVHNGPRLSALFDRIAARDPEVAPRDGTGRPLFTVCRELASVGHLPAHSTGEPERDRARARSLAVVLREHPAASTAPGEVALPVAALLARSPLTGNTVLADVLADSDPARRDRRFRAPPGPRLDTARHWLRLHLDLGLPPLLGLLVRYGIALEPHPQNTVLVLRDGLPHRFLVRDIGGVRVLTDRLRRRGHRFRPHEDSALASVDPAALRDKLYFPLFGNHLGELVAAAAAATGYSEDPLWRVVRDSAGEVFDRLRSTARCREEADDCARDAEALLRRPWRLKTMLGMRLSGLVTEQRYVPAPNPLSAA
ncbi:IucA/IucC family siderophore biosynthesis protein [Actinopolyspora erythraea]|uniref:IucA/IucC family siderophore biosynthesis protein n=1 Tax=Actinopolyspora erythraea TaxID=414996 RepID=A0A223RNN1_9ACTN|nr:IucA/IucC family protein [Actinopolyspora erythraea]ASU77489.1 IucA/IucC family siderophore biosynthesis protein [Actinopolyspora erythraea]